MAKTYILVGHDRNGAFADDVAAFEQRGRDRGDVEIIYAKPGQSMADVARDITPPANVMLLAHGDEHGRFEWTKGSRVGYKKLFEQLPQGVESVTIGSCYGGKSLAKEMLEHAKPGTIIQSQVGAKVVGWGDGGKSAKEITSYPEITQLTLLLESLDAVDPKKFSEWSKRDGFNSNPNDVLPHTVGIGGRPPKEMDLNVEMQNLRGKNVNPVAVTKVKEHFDKSLWEGVRSEEELDRRIDSVVQKLKGGDVDPRAFTPEEKRIGYGLAVAHLHETGEIKHRVEQAIEEPKQAAEREKAARAEAAQKRVEAEAKPKEEPKEEQKPAPSEKRPEPAKPQPEQSKPKSEIHRQEPQGEQPAANKAGNFLHRLVDKFRNGGQAPTKQELQELVQVMDLDTNTKLTQAEIKKSVIAAIDKDGDGIVDKEYAQMVRHADKNRDGQIQLSEVQKEIGITAAGLLKELKMSGAVERDGTVNAATSQVVKNNVAKSESREL